jgi:DNA-binding MarR family transcriptional regulator
MPVKFTFESPLLRAWLLIHQSHNLLKRSEDSILAELGLTTRKHSILLAVKNLKDPITVSDVAHWLDRSSNGISMMIDQLEKDGLVQRQRDMSDHRTVRLILTERGDKLLEESNALFWKMIKDIFSTLPPEELNTTIGIVTNIRLRTLDFLKLDSSARLQVLPNIYHNSLGDDEE